MSKGIYTTSGMPLDPGGGGLLPVGPVGVYIYSCDTEYVLGLIHYSGRLSGRHREQPPPTGSSGL